MKLEGTQPPPQIARREIDRITEQPDGNVLFKFSSFREYPFDLESFNSRRSFSDNRLVRSEPLNDSQRYRFRKPHYRTYY